MIMTQCGRRRKAADEVVLVAPADGTRTDALMMHMPALEALVRSFDAAPLMRASMPGGWRAWDFDSRSLPFVPKRSIRLRVTRIDRPDEDEGLHAVKPQDVISITGIGPQGTVRIRIRHVGDLLWSMMSRRELVASAGMLAASALGATRSLISGEGVVSLIDARETSRLASLHHHRNRVSDVPDLSALGDRREVESFVPVWMLTAEAQGIMIEPVIEMADPEHVGIIDLMRIAAGAARIEEAAERRRIANGGRTS